jgi:acyl carrier protein
MWLLNVSTLELEEFIGSNIPPYGILSHTWGLEEVTFTLMKKAKHRPEAERKAGYFKIRGCCKQARKDGLKYAWIDSCCIDKRNSAELSEALNSMFQWYKLAAKCYVYLSDVPSDEETREQMFEKSKWFTRGWTLQELLAPQELVFFAQDWTSIGYKASIGANDQDSDEGCVDLTKEISRITEIPIEYLMGQKAISQACLAQRMYWAARRETTRAEDRAYSLMGLFDINMPILYGEGLEKAFGRLQREIIHRSPDQSILAWYNTHASSHRMLADSPDCFRNSRAVTQMERSPLGFDTWSNWSCFVMTNLGLQITLPLVTKQNRRQFRYGDGAKAALHCVEGSSNGSQRRIYLDLVFLNNDLEGRPVFMCHRLRQWTLGAESGIPTSMYLCGNDYISALAEQKVVKVSKVKATAGSVANRFMDILVDETGCAMDELRDDRLFVEIGIDSLMTLCISARVQDELGRDIGTDTFVNCPTIGAFKMYLASSQAGETAEI